MAERRDKIIAVLSLLTAVTVIGVDWSWARDVARGRQTLWGDPCYTPPHPPQWEAVDLLRVHRDLLPRWSIAAAKSGDPVDQQREAEAWAALAEALAPDPNLLALATDIREATRAGVWMHHGDLQYWMWAWSRYLEAPGWRVEGGVRDPGDGAFLFVKTYRVVADTTVPLDGEARRVRLLRRADHTTTVENYLGHSGSGGGEGALLLAHRIEAFTIDQIWPLLDPSLDSRRTGPPRAWGPPIRAEVRAALSAEHVGALTRTAAHRDRMLRTRDQVHERSACSGFHISRVDWRGFSDTLTRSLRRAVARDRDTPCPTLTEDELQILSTGPDEPALPEALEALVAFTARATALHEAQHLADRDAPPACTELGTCAALGLRPEATQELSAYLTSFASEEVGATAFYQACRATHHGTGSHAEAVTAAARVLLPRGCANPPPADLARQAQALRAAWRGADLPPKLTADFPTTVALSAY